MSAPSATKEFAFSGSLCRLSEFETEDGVRYCLTIFSISDYKHLHFPHDEYKWLICKLYSLQSPHAIYPTIDTQGMQKSAECVLAVQQLPFTCELKIKFGTYRNLNVGPVTAFGLVKTNPFTEIDVFSINKTPLACDPKWDICTCKTCIVFDRLIDFEASVLGRFSRHRLENVILFQKDKRSRHEPILQE